MGASMRCLCQLNGVHSTLLLSAEDLRLPATRFVSFAIGGLVLLLQACAQSPPSQVVSPAAERPPVPEINLNLPAPVEPVFAGEPEDVWASAMESIGLDPNSLPLWTPSGGEGPIN